MSSRQSTVSLKKAHLEATGPSQDDYLKIQDASDQGLSANATKLLQERFLLTLEDGSQETPAQMMQRVATTLALQEDPEHRPFWEKIFFATMNKLFFHSGSRVMANAGTKNQQLANCFVLPLEDDRHQILKVFAEACDIKGNGGGCGFNYSAIRPRGDQVREHSGLACGPTALMKLFDEASSIFRQKGRYESGNMAIINVDHPDLLEFISAKERDGSLRLTNISVGITNQFMEAVERGDVWHFIHPVSAQKTGQMDAKSLFASICEQACRTGDPGLVFLDRINEDNPLLEAIGPIAATNTCGEIGLFPYESCNLGYLNLVRFLDSNPAGGQTSLFNHDLLRVVVHVAVRMIDNAISASWFPIGQINDSVRANRRIGLGLTGWADCLSIAGIPYDSARALHEAEKLSSTMRRYAEEATKLLAQEKGPYPNSKYSGEVHRRNISLLALPPSGNNAIIFDTSFSIEPHFSLAYVERVLDDKKFYHKNKHLERALQKADLKPDLIFEEIAKNNGSVQNLAAVPAEIRNCFKTAHEISPECHVRMQAAFQDNVDNAVTKTVNLPYSATPDDVANCYKLAWSLGCKGITVYRDGSRSEQAIEFDGGSSEADSWHCEECVDINIGVIG